MPRIAASIAPDAIRIEDEVWQEAFDQRAPRRRRPAPARRPVPARRSEAARPRRPEARAADRLAPPPVPATAVAAAPPASEATPPAAPGRRTVVITGRGAERNMPWETGISPRRSSRLPHHRHTFRPDRVAMWAVFLGLLLVLVAAMSAH